MCFLNRVLKDDGRRGLKEKECLHFVGLLNLGFKHKSSSKISTAWTRLLLN